MPITIFPLDTRSTTSFSSVISAPGTLAAKLVVTLTDIGTNGLLVRLWQCSESGELGSSFLAEAHIYENQTVVIGVQPGIDATDAELIESYRLITLNAPIPPFFKVQALHEEVSPMTYGIEMVLY